jgi:hypothetical protein
VCKASIRRAAPFSRLLRHARIYSNLDLTQSPPTTRKGMLRSYFYQDPHGSHSVPSYDTQGDAEDLSLSGSPRVDKKNMNSLDKRGPSYFTRVESYISKCI